MNLPSNKLISIESVNNGELPTGMRLHPIDDVMLVISPKWRKLLNKELPTELIDIIIPYKNGNISDLLDALNSINTQSLRTISDEFSTDIYNKYVIDKKIDFNEFNDNITTYIQSLGTNISSKNKLSSISVDLIKLLDSLIVSNNIPIKLPVLVCIVKDHDDTNLDFLISLHWNFTLVILNNSAVDSSGKLINAGVGNTRNLGIGLTNSPWIMFMDQDDELQPNSLSTLYNSAIVNNSPLSKGLWLLEELDEHNNPRTTIINGMNLTQITGCLINREFIDMCKVRFHPELSFVSEDAFFTKLLTGCILNYDLRWSLTEVPVYKCKASATSLSRSKSNNYENRVIAHTPQVFMEVIYRLMSIPHNDKVMTYVYALANQLCVYVYYNFYKLLHEARYKVVYLQEQLEFVKLIWSDYNVICTYSQFMNSVGDYSSVNPDVSIIEFYSNEINKYITTKGDHYENNTNIS